MKTIFKSTIAFALAFWMSTAVSLQAAERSVTIDGITYFVDLDDETHSSAYVGTSDENIEEANILSEVKIGNDSYTVTKIGESAFSYRGNLKNVSMPATVKIIDDRAFYCSYPAPIELHEGLEKVGYFAGIPCGKNLKLPNSLKSYSYYSFTWGFDLVTIKNLSSFCHLEFDDHYSARALFGDVFDTPLYLNEQEIIDLVIPSDISTINYCGFANCPIEGVNTNKVTKVGQHAFSHCKNLREAVIGMNVDSEDIAIESDAFTTCEKLEYVELGSTVTQIGERAFANLKSLDKVLCHSMTPPAVNENTFENTYPSWVTLYVPVGAKAAYKADPVWGQFGEIIEEFEEAGIKDISEGDNAPIEYYDLNGIRIDEPEHGVFIHKQGSKIKKIVL